MKCKYRLAAIKKLLLCVVIFMLLRMTMKLVLFDDDSNSAVNEICKIPNLDPWDASILKYLTPKSEKLQCPKAYNIMFVNDSGFIHYNHSAIDYYSLQNKLLKCNYQTVERILGDKEVNFGSKKGFVPPTFVNSTYFRVSCESNKKLVYDFLHFNPFWIEDQSRDNEIDVEDDDHYSVLLIGIDSVSRSDALRSLPKSYKYLMETLDAYDFRGYMKVGSNTFPNLIPLLTGMRHGSFPLVNSRISYCDSMPLLWNERELQRYATLYSDDRSDISTFHLLKPGFYNSPTDFYYRPYNMAMDLFTPIIMNPISTKNCPWECPCYANKDNFTIQVNHFKGFLNRYKGKLKFTLFWGNAAHESFGLLQHLDNTLLELLQWMRVNGHLGRAVVAVLSDHGLRLGEFSQTYIGRLESHFPFLSLVVPKKLEKRYPEIKRNLLLNSHKLTTHFDIHRTIIDIANSYYETKAPPVDNSLVARNIFSFIPETRTCADAGIPPNFCTCVGDEKILSTDNDILLKPLAAYAVSQLNSILANHTDICRHLTLFNITESRVQYACLNADRNNHKRGLGLLDSFLKYNFGYDFSEKCGKSGRYKLLFHTLPSKGLFETMVEYDEDTDGGQKNKMSLVGDIARIDRYGEQSHCIKQNALLREYCYCKDIG